MPVWITLIATWFRPGILFGSSIYVDGRLDRTLLLRRCIGWGGIVVAVVLIGVAAEWLGLLGEEP